MQHDEPALFTLPDTLPPPSEPLISEAQVASIRQAFSSTGIDSMKDRQELLQSCTVRPISNIRELYARDVRRILKRINERSQTAVARSGSAWDNRDEDTWIDKL